MSKVKRHLPIRQPLKNDEISINETLFCIYLIIIMIDNKVSGCLHLVFSIRSLIMSIREMHGKSWKYRSAFLIFVQTLIHMTSFAVGTKIEHPKFGKGVVIDDSDEYIYVIYFGEEHGEKEISKSFDGMIVVKMVEKDKDAISLDQVRSILQEIIEPLTEPLEDCKIAEKWEGGNLVMQPKDKSLQSKELPIEAFFHKIVMTRDRLRVMEQKINASRLSDVEKVELQQYVTRIYGSLTTFNVLFRFKDDQFKGTGGGD